MSVLCAAAAAAAAAEVWPGSNRCTSVWQTYNSSKRHLKQAFESSKSFSNALSHFLFDYEDEMEFFSAWERLIEKHDISESEWLSGLFMEKEKWASPYQRIISSDDILTTLQKDVSCNDLKDIFEKLPLFVLLKFQLIKKCQLIQRTCY